MPRGSMHDLFSRSVARVCSVRTTSFWSFLFYAVVAFLMVMSFLSGQPSFFSHLSQWYATQGILFVSKAVVRIVLWGGLVLSIFRFRLFREYFGGISRRTWLVLLGIVVALFLIKPYIPHTVWHSNSHGISIVAGIRDNAETVDLSLMHGFGTEILLKDLYHVVFGKHFSVFTVNYILAVLAVFVLFLLVYLMTESEGSALLSAFLLAVLPVHLRLAATECTYISVELYLLLMLLFLFLFIRSGRPVFFVSMLPWVFLAMQSRQDMLFLVPVCLLLSLVFFERRHYERLAASRAVWCSLVLFALLFFPRVMMLIFSPDNRLFELDRKVSLGFEWTRTILFDPAMRSRFNVFFSPQYTPVVYVLLFCIGAAVMMRSRTKLLLFCILNICLFSFFYLPYWDGISTLLRTGLMSQPFFMIVCAAGMAWLFRLWKEHRAIHMVWCVVVCLVFLCGLVPYTKFLRTVYSVQQEYLFLERARAVLPEYAIVVYLSGKDVPGTTAYNEYQALALYGPSRSFSGIQEFMKEHGRQVPAHCYFLLGAPCYKISIPADGRKQQAVLQRQVPKDYMQPLSRELLRRFVVVPVVETVISKNNMSIISDVIAGDTARLVLYKIVGRK